MACSKTYIAFDIDGTLYDISPVVVSGFETGIVNFKRTHPDVPVQVPGRDEIVAVLGMPIPYIFETLFPSLSPGERRVVNDCCNESLSDLIRRGKGTLFPCVYETLYRLHEKGYRLLVASNGRKEYVEAVLETYGLDGFFSPPFVYLNEEISDKTEIVARYKRAIPPEACLIMVGDRSSDRMAAVDNGIPFIGCAFGHAGLGEIAGTEWIAREVRDIPKLVEHIRNAGVPG